VAGQIYVRLVRRKAGDARTVFDALDDLPDPASQPRVVAPGTLPP
jgi:hypothetical protein